MKNTNIDYDTYDYFGQNNDEDASGEDFCDLEQDEASKKRLEELIAGEKQTDDWVMFGLNKEYPGKFDESYALGLMYQKDASGNIDAKSQEEAVRYANYFAKKNNNDAKNFIIDIVQRSKINDPTLVGDTGAIACTSFYLFFRNYIRTEADKYYKRQPISDSERASRMADAIQTAFAMIYENIDKYDPTIAKINTFFGKKQILGAFYEFESKRKGYKSKQSMRISQTIIKEANRLESEGIEKNAAIISHLTKQSVNQVNNALQRAKIEQNTGTLNTPDLNNSGGYVSQKVYETPEQKLQKEEQTRELIEHLSVLDERELFVYLAYTGVVCTGNRFYEEKPMSYSEIEAKYGINKDDAKMLYNTAVVKLRGSYNKKAHKKEKVISGNCPMFLSGEKDSDLDDIIEVKDN